MNKRNSKAFLESLSFRQREQAFTRDLSGNYAVNVLVAPTGVSYTDNRVVVLDSLCGEKDGFDLPHRIRLVRANNIHETYHLIETDFDAYKKWIQRRQFPQVEQPFLNLVEDAWIEWSCSQKTPVFYRDIVWLNECLVRGGIDHVDQGSELAQFQNLVLIYLVGKEDASSKISSKQVKERFLEAKRIGDELYQWKGNKFREEVTEEIIKLAQLWMSKGGPAPSSSGFMSFHGPPSNAMNGSQMMQVQAMQAPIGQPGQTGTGKGTRKRAGAKVNPANPQNANQQNDPQMPGDNMDPGAASAESQENLPGTDPQAQGASSGSISAEDLGAGQDNQKSSGGSGEEDAAAAAELDALREQETAALIEAIRQELEQDSERLKDAQSQATSAGQALSQCGFSTRLVDSPFPSISSLVNQSSSLLEAYIDAIDSTRIGVNNLNRDMSALRSEDQEWETGKLSGSRVDMKRVWRNSPEVMMRRRIQETTFDPAFTIMMDMSGSTGSGIHDSYRQTCLMLRAFCERWNIPFSAFGHWIDGGSNEFEVLPIQWFEKAEHDPIMWAAMQARTNARDDLAILWGSNYMASSQNKPDKILFVMVDGEPNHHAGTERYSTLTARSTNLVAIKQAKMCGVEVISVGVGVDLSPFFEHSIFVSHPNDMAKHLSQLIRERLRGY